MHKSGKCYTIVEGDIVKSKEDVIIISVGDKPEFAAEDSVEGRFYQKYSCKKGKGEDVHEVSNNLKDLRRQYSDLKERR